MPIYSAPTKDTLFLLSEWLKVHERADIPGYDELTPDFVETVVSAMARFAENVTFPINAAGDREGCSFSDGEVTTPSGFKEAYRQYRDDGWFGLAAPQRYGGLDLPMVLASGATECLAASNPTFGMYVGTNKHATVLLRKGASEAQMDTYVPRLATGEWTATMVMTESGAGSDLGLMRAQAVEQPDGTYRISGTKIFISSGEHDLTSNIVHLVLAKIPGGPAGSKGISLFIVPKFLHADDGTLGERNGVWCESIEEKMGQHGSATCTLRFNRAVGYLVGAPHEGLRPMFEMMNATRISIGMQVTGIADVAYQNAVAYCRERKQGRSAGSGLSADEAEPIIAHPDVRRMLMICRSFSEGARALCLWTSLNLDVAERHADADTRRRHADLVAFLTPIIKGYLSDVAEEVTSTAMQCFGGYGYIVETGVEQYLRDVRVTRIYEGTSGMQALDLVGRKLLALRGAGLRVLMQRIQRHLDRAEPLEPMREFNAALRSTSRDLAEASEWIGSHADRDAHTVGGAASHYLALAGVAVLTFVWCRLALACVTDDADAPIRRDKLATGRFFIEQFSPDTGPLLAKIRSGCDATMALDAESF